MKYKVGDKVKVHTKEWFEKNCYINNAIGSYSLNRNSYSVISDMINFCGQEVTIYKVNADSYRISEDKRRYWEDWMFEDMNNNTNTIFNPNIVEDFAKLIGVELDEEFYDSKGGFRYKFTSDSGLMVYDNKKEDWRVASAYSLTSFFKMIKEGKFTKKWIPKDNEKIYYVDFYNENLYNYIFYNPENEHLKNLLDCNMLYRTEQEAIEAAKKYMNQMKGEN